MKKLLVFLLIFVSGFALASCKTEKEPKEIEVRAYNFEDYFTINHSHKVLNNQFIIDIEVTPKDSVLELIEKIQFKLSFTYTYRYTQNGNTNESLVLYEHADITIERLEKVIAKITADLFLPEGATFESLTISKRTINPLLIQGKIKAYK